MGGFVWDADAEDDGPYVSECVRVIAEGAGFAGAAERVVLRVEEEDDVLAPQVPEPDGHTVLVVPFEVRRPVARFAQVDQSARPIRSEDKKHSRRSRASGGITRRTRLQSPASDRRHGQAPSGRGVTGLAN